MAQSGKCGILDFGSGQDLMIQPLPQWAWSLPRILSLSLSLLPSLSKTNYKNK